MRKVIRLRSHPAGISARYLKKQNGNVHTTKKTRITVMCEGREWLTLVEKQLRVYICHGISHSITTPFTWPSSLLVNSSSPCSPGDFDLLTDSSLSSSLTPLSDLWSAHWPVSLRSPRHPVQQSSICSLTRFSLLVVTHLSCSLLGLQRSQLQVRWGSN